MNAPRYDGLRRLAADAWVAFATWIADRITGGEHARQLARCAELADAMSVDVEAAPELRRQVAALTAEMQAAARRSAQVAAQGHARVAEARRLTDQQAARADDVLQVLIDHGHTTAVTGGATPAAAVAAALRAPVPEGSDITERLAQAVAAWTRVGGHAHLFDGECREIAYVLAPLVAAWIRDGAPVPTTTGATT